MYETKASQHQSVHFPFEESKNYEKKCEFGWFSVGRSPLCTLCEYVGGWRTEF